MGGNEEDGVESKGKSNKCKYCGKDFTSRQALGGHMNKHREERDDERLQEYQALCLSRGRTPIFHPLVRDISTPFSHPQLAGAGPASFHGGGPESIQSGLIARGRPWGGLQVGHNQNMQPSWQQPPRFNSQSSFPHGLPHSPFPHQPNLQHPGSQFHEFPPQPYPNNPGGQGNPGQPPFSEPRLHSQQFPFQQFPYQLYPAGNHIDPSFQRSPLPTVGILPPAETGLLPHQPHADLGRLPDLQSLPSDRHQLNADVDPSSPVQFHIPLDDDYLSRPGQLPPDYEDDAQCDLIALDHDWLFHPEIFPALEDDAQSTSLASASSCIAGNSDNFHDLSEGRNEFQVMKDQFWAVFDNSALSDGMPRLYCKIIEVSHSPFFMEAVLLQPNFDETNDKRFDWLFDRDILSMGAGQFKLGNEKVHDTGRFSHLMDIKDNNHGYEVFPKAPEVWAMYADYGKEVSNKDEDGNLKFQYKFVLIKRNFSASTGVGWKVAELQKLGGHKTLWVPRGDSYALTVEDDLKKFSHRVPAETARDVGVPSDCLVLDPACACEYPSSTPVADLAPTCD